MVIGGRWRNPDLDNTDCGYDIGESVADSEARGAYMKVTLGME